MLTKQVHLTCDGPVALCGAPISFVAHILQWPKRTPYMALIQAREDRRHQWTPFYADGNRLLAKGFIRPDCTARKLTFDLWMDHEIVDHAEVYVVSGGMSGQRRHNRRKLWIPPTVDRRAVRVATSISVPNNTFIIHAADVLGISSEDIPESGLF